MKKFVENHWKMPPKTHKNLTKISAIFSQYFSVLMH